jgi:hypothetical protein
MTLTELGEREGYRPDALARWLRQVDYIHAEVTRQRLVDRLEAGVAVLEAGGQVQAAADAHPSKLRRHADPDPPPLADEARVLPAAAGARRPNRCPHPGMVPADRPPHRRSRWLAIPAARILGWSPQTVRRIAARDGWRFNGMEWVRTEAA